MPSLQPVRRRKKARDAAEEIAAFESRPARIEGRLTALTWVVGLHFTLTVAGFGATLAVLIQVVRQLGAIGAKVGLA